MYKLFKDPMNVNYAGVVLDNKTAIPFSVDNTDYQNFKKQINADEAQLEDADGNLMLPEAAKDFVKELP